jgi:hypothetical protein
MYIFCAIFCQKVKEKKLQPANMLKKSENVGVIAKSI